MAVENVPSAVESNAFQTHDEAGRDTGETTESFSQRTRLTLENV